MDRLLNSSILSALFQPTESNWVMGIWSLLSIIALKRHSLYRLWCLLYKITFHGDFNSSQQKTTEQSQWHRSDVIFLNVELISDLFLHFYCWLWTSKCLLGKDPGETTTKKQLLLRKESTTKMESELFVLFMKLIKVKH